MDNPGTGRGRWEREGEGDGIGQEMLIVLPPGMTPVPPAIPAAVFATRLP